MSTNNLALLLEDLSLEDISKDELKIINDAVNMSKVDLYKLIEYYNNAYHNGTGLISDTVFDYLEDIYESKYGFLPEKVGS